MGASGTSRIRNMNARVELLELKPCRAVQGMALWAVQNLRLGVSGPCILGLALDSEPPPAGTRTLEQRREEKEQWQWWLEHACDETTFLRALREREGIELNATDMDSVNYAWLSASPRLDAPRRRPRSTNRSPASASESHP